MPKKENKIVEENVDYADITAIDDVDLSENTDIVVQEENAGSDVIVYEPQKQDLILYEKLEKTKTTKRGIFSLIIIIIIALLIIAIGGFLYKGLSQESALSKDNFDLKPRSNEALAVDNETKTLTVSPYEYNGFLDLKKYFKSESSSLSFDIFTSDGKNQKIEKLDLADVYKQKDKNPEYTVKVSFKSNKKYFYTKLKFDFKNVIVLKTPSGDCQVSYNEYMKNRGSYITFFEKELRKNKILNAFSSKNDALNRDVKQWFFDNNRQQNFSIKEFEEIKKDDKVKELVLYSNNSFSNGITVEYKFIMGDGIFYTTYAKDGDVLPDLDILNDLKNKLIYPTMKRDINDEFSDESREKAKEYYEFVGWFYKNDYDELGIKAGAEFKMDQKVPSIKYASYEIVPKFVRKAVDIYYMSGEDLLKNEDDYNLKDKKSTKAKLTKKDGGFNWEYELLTDVSDEGDTYFTNWFLKSGNDISNNAEINIERLKKDETKVFAFPKYRSYIKARFELVNLENLKLNQINGRDNEKIFDKVNALNENKRIIGEVENYREIDGNYLDGYYLSNGEKIDENTTFAYIESFENKIYIRYKKVNVSVNFDRLFFDSETQKLKTERISTHSKFYETGKVSLGEILNEYKDEIINKYPDYIMEEKKADFTGSLVGVKNQSFTITIRVPNIILKAKIDSYNEFEMPVYKGQILNMDYNYNSDQKVVGYKIKLSDTEEIDFFTNSNLDMLVKKENDGKEFVAQAYFEDRFDGTISIKKVFIDDNLKNTDPNRIRTYYVKSKIKDIKLGSWSYDLYKEKLDYYISIKDGEVSNPGIFEYVGSSGSWPNYQVVDSEITFTYYRKSAVLYFQYGSDKHFEIRIRTEQEIQSNEYSKLLNLMAPYIEAQKQVGKTFKGWGYGNKLYPELEKEKARKFVLTWDFYNSHNVATNSNHRVVLIPIYE